ncbi:hypothetical protein L1987_47590 [Smallanthus sonchifolius]|uniref:Uncharacterized protein n=1 Tax=Smallanthus sonchifolius TaxID=185202 RepID=A0ACB9G316_9ASTR|nr:hypothetical protein L1987_47590 [Smallanthus sonchifolius]
MLQEKSYWIHWVGNVSRNRIEDIMPIATGAEIQDASAVGKPYYDQRIVGCPGAELEVVSPGGPPDGHGDEGEHQQITDSSFQLYVLE